MRLFFSRFFLDHLRQALENGHDDLLFVPIPLIIPSSYAKTRYFSRKTPEKLVSGD